jgi:NAD(P)H-dependent flavin oxidoreductase YrpB (nitropropane dioxygenase family)
VEVALKHPKVRAFANALGTPPAEVIKEIQATGRLVGALCGSAKQALSHKEAGLDFIIAQGTEGGGHTGEIGSIVLWPEVIEAAAPIPVLAAGGIGSGKQMAAAMALGAQGVWTGSIWLTVSEADTPPAQKESFLKATSRDTVRSRSWTGKPCRMLKNDWTEAWEKPENPKPLGMPLQFMVTADAVSRGHHYASKAQAVGFNPVGQIVGRMNEIRSARHVIQDMVQDYIDATERLQGLLA